MTAINYIELKPDPLKKIILSVFVLCALFAAAQPTYEFRAVWIATVDNIDWPPRNNYNPEAQKAEYIRQLDLHKKNGMNAVIVQVRPASDAFYVSPFEPWSQWLTGEQGKPPVPFYDPLQFMVDEAHKRGFEFHAWCNPYRANFSIGKSSIAYNHITRLYPQWFLKYGNQLFFDPGNKEAQDWVIRVVKDIVARYDVDAIHMDDYFYPYRIAGVEFPDTASYRKYGQRMNKEDWRRSNTDSIIRHLNTAIKETKPWCKFGISPFGVWRNSDKDEEGSPTKAGVTNYDDLYADVLLWAEEGWVDYLAPQLYWERGHKLVAYETLIDWWSKHAYGRHMYIGHGIYRFYEPSSRAWKNPTEIPAQISLLRQYPSLQGSIYFSSKSFDRNPNGWNDSLQNNYYKTAAFIPPMPWVDKYKPLRPIASFSDKTGYANGIALHVKKDQSSRPIKSFIVYKFEDGQPIRKDPGSLYKVVAASSEEIITLPYFDLAKTSFAVSCIDLANNESELCIVEKGKK